MISRREVILIGGVATDTLATQIEYVGNGSSVTPYPVPFRVLAEGDVGIYRRTNQVPYALYQQVAGTVHLIPETGMAEVRTSEAWSSASNILVKRITPQLQPLVVPESGKMPSKSLERGYDRLTCMVQELQRQFSYTLHLQQPGGDYPEDGPGLLPPIHDGVIGFLGGVLRIFTFEELSALIGPPVIIDSDVPDGASFIGQYPVKLGGFYITF